MGLKDKQYQARMDGLAYAQRIVKEQGIEALDKEIKMRRAVFIPLEISREKLGEVTSFIEERIMSTMMPTMLFVLHEEFGFGKKRMLQFKDGFLHRCDMLATLDPLGGHYETIMDYVKELEKYGIEFNVDTIEDVARTNDEKRKCYAELGYVLELLERKGFPEAAEVIRAYM